MTTATQRRFAFTLIELLVVIAILAVLAALSAGTYFRIRSSQQTNSTESTLEKLNMGLERLYSGKRDEAEKEYTNGNFIAGVTKEKLLGASGGPNQKDRAKAVYLYFRMKYEFPQTFPEAKATLSWTHPTAGLVFSAPAKQMFRNVPNIVDPGKLLTAGDYNDQAAALLYIILSEMSSRGETFDASALQGFTADRAIKVNTSTNPHQTQNFRVFIDSWGSPVTYVRFLANGEIDSQPFARNSSFQLVNPIPAGATNSPFDVTAKLTNTPDWNIPPSATQAFTSFYQAAGISTQTSTPASIERLLRQNFLPAVISAGANKTWDGLDVRGFNTATLGSPPPANTPANIGIVLHDPATGANLNNDNIYGYRLRKFGARGD